MRFLKRCISLLRQKMDRNFLLAFLLSMLMIIGYYMIYPPEQQAPQPQVEENAEESKESATSSEAITEIAVTEDQQPAIEEIEALSRKSVKVESDLYSIEIDSQDGSLTKMLLKDYKYNLEPHFQITKFVVGLFTGGNDEEEPWDPNRLVNLAGDISDTNKIWKVETGPDKQSINYSVSADQLDVSSQAQSLELKAVLPNGLVETKQFTFYPDTYEIDFVVKLLNRTGASQMIHPKVNFGAGGEAISREPLPQPKVAVTYFDDDFEKYDGGDVEETLTIDKTHYAGLMDKYFVTAIKTVDGSDFKAELTPVNSKLDGKDVVVPQLTYVDRSTSLGNNQEYSRSFRIYAGPKVHSKLEQYDEYLPKAIDMWLEVIAEPLMVILRWLQGYVVNWGVAIILLTIIVRTAMFPLAYKGMTSMRKMQALGPKITALREKYKNNKERMNQEIMKFYGQHKVNPMGGCLPMLLQIPIFIALYQALLPAIELRHTPFFIWWSDLSAADYTLILPILMGVSMYVQQSLTPTPTMDPTQAKIMKWMPVMMVMFFLNMPSGLVLYWVVSNIISVGQQLVFNKVSPPAPVEVPEKGKAKTTTNKKKGKAKK